MKNRTNTSQLLLLTVVLLVASSLQAQQSAPDNDFILRGLATEIAGVLARHGLTEVGRLDDPPPGEEVFVVRAAPSVPPSQVISDVLSHESSVGGLEEVFLASLPEASGGAVLNPSTTEILGALGDTSTVLFGKDASGVDRDVWSGYVLQAADLRVRASEARALESGDGTVVAIIDSGIDPDHELFDGVLVPGYDFLLDQAGAASEWSLLDESTVAILGESTVAILGDEEVVALSESTVAILGSDQAADLGPIALPDAFGHGTMVAGIVHLVAPEAKIMPLRVFDGNGQASIFDIVRAIYHAVDHGATVINMSFSFDGYSQELSSAIAYAALNGVRCVASVGNDGQNAVVYPAMSLGVVGVAAADELDYLSSFSNYGLFLASVAAPGETIITAYPGGGWAAGSGTSFAAPWVTGAVALLADQQGSGAPGDLSAFEVFNAFSASDPLYGPYASSIVHGRLDIRAALDQLAPAGGGDDGD